MTEYPEYFLRDKQVLLRLPISRAAWWLGVKEGRYPAGIKISHRVTVWTSSSIDALIQSLISK